MTENYPHIDPLQEKPGEVMAISIMTLISGVTNIIAGLTISFLVVVGTIGIGIVCVPLTILPLVLGVFEIIYAARLLSSPPAPLQPSQAIAILEICAALYLNLISLVTGILALVFYNSPKVRDYFKAINSQ
jgi:hypothetical protein